MAIRLFTLYAPPKKPARAQGVDPDAIVGFGGATGEDPASKQLWGTLCDLAEMIGVAVRVKDRPQAPWCGVVVLPALAGQLDADWLEDFERCIAWTVLEL